MRAHSFEPIADASSRVLVLGSMPGKASLRAGEYYAHPQNLFWPFMHEILGVERVAPYAERSAQLRARGVALWDVVQTCTRESSLDSDIVSSTVRPNDFEALLKRYPAIETVCFNGVKAADLFQRHVLSRVARCDTLVIQRLPSTSPANASIPRAKKLAAWKTVAAAARD